MNDLQQNAPKQKGSHKDEEEEEKEGEMPEEDNEELEGESIKV